MARQEQDYDIIALTGADRQLVAEVSPSETVDGEKGDKTMYGQKTIENNVTRRMEEAGQRRMIRENLDCATAGRLLLCDQAEEFPAMGRMFGEPIPLSAITLRRCRKRGGPYHGEDVRPDYRCR
jgi:hypothetical protein